MSRLVFIAGTGRSGTNMLGRLISSHPSVEGRLEEAETFDLITKMATRWDLVSNRKKRKWMVKLESRLKWLANTATRPILLEKSHPCLWLTESLLEKFDDCLFIGVWRPVLPTVSSMLVHGGVLKWYSKLPLTKPNRFLGITSENRMFFRRLSIEQQCVYRWQSHKDEIHRLSIKYPSRFLNIQYDQFVMDKERSLNNLSEFLGISNAFEDSIIRTDSLEKWKSVLSSEQIDMINNCGKIK